MKKTWIIIAGIVLAVGLAGLLAIYTWNGIEIRSNVRMAQDLYPGSAEEALISLLQDESVNSYVRTHSAIWTLGQIRSEKALPLLKELYLEDPKGKSCYGKHDSVLCQYEIHKAIQAIEHWRPFSHGRIARK